MDIKDDIHPAFQLRRYAWTMKLPLSILTDFEEFAVYDCSVKPDKMDKASNARIFYLNYKDYLTRWDEIAGIFSKNAVMKGSFDRYAADKKSKRGTSAVDVVFLEEIAGWREILARNIALRNTELSTKDLNYAVQAIVDRIVFLRICEDRGIERSMRLQDLLNGERVYPRLCEFFRRADERYNSGIFHFEKEPGRESPDTLTLSLNIDDKPLKEIIKQSIEAYQEALKIYTVERYPIDYAGTQNNLGNALKAIGRTSEADAAFAKAKKLGYNG